MTFQYLSNRTGKDNFTREFKVYECEDCSDCPLRSQCTKAKEGIIQKYIIMKNGNNKKHTQNNSFQKKTGKIYIKRKIDVEPVFGFLKANLRFTRMLVNLRKYAAKHVNGTTTPEYNLTKKVHHLSMMIGTFFRYFWLVMFQPFFIF